MAVLIKRIRSTRLPDIHILAIEGNPTTYLAHMTEVVGLLLNKPRKGASDAIHSFLRSDAGKHIKCGGDLRTSFQNGPSTSMVYTYHLGNGGGGKHPSYFATQEAIQEIIKNLPNQDEASKSKYQQIFEQIFADPQALSSFQENNSDSTHTRPSKRIKPALHPPADEPCAGVYVLRFDDNTLPRFYVGKSNDITKRLQQHGDGHGSACVAGRAFKRIPTIVRGHRDDLEGWERAEVLERMYEVGINAVRGWKYTLQLMPIDQKLSAFDDVCERFDLCRNCGRSTHFIRDCQALTTDRWTNGLELRSFYRRCGTSEALIDAAQAKATEEREARLLAERKNEEAVRLLLGAT